MRNLLIALLLVATSAASAFAQGGNNPFEPLLRDYEAKSKKLLAEMEKKVGIHQATLVAEMSAQIEQLIMDGEQPSADKLKQLLTAIKAAPDFVTAADTIAADILPLKTGAHHIVIKYLDGVLTIDKEYAPKLEKLKVATLKTMKQQLGRGARLDPALVERATKFMYDFLAIPNPKFDGEIPPMPEEEREASVVWQRTATEFNAAWDQELLRQKNQLFVELHEVLVAAKANKNALVIQQLSKIDEIFRRPPPANPLDIIEDQKREKGQKLAGYVHPRDPSGWIMSHLDDVDDVIDPVLQNYMKQCALINDRFEGLMARLDSRWAARNSKELKKLMLSSAPLEEQFSEVKKLMRMSRMSIDWLSQSFAVKLPGVAEEAMVLLNDLEAAGKETLFQANNEDAELRNELITQLKGLVDADAVEESGRLDLLSSLTSDYGEGIRGTLVFDVDPRLSKEAQKLMEKYLAKAEQLREKVFATQANKVAECKSKLKAQRTAMIQKDDFLGAILLDLHLARRSYPIGTIWIRYGTGPSFSSKLASYGLSLPVQLLSRDSEKGFLVCGPNEQWMWVKREQVALSYSDYSESEEQVGKQVIWTNQYRENSKDPASRPLKADQRVAVGDQVLVPIGFGWEQQTVQDLSPFGIVVHPLSYGADIRTEVLPRGIVRWIVDQKKP